MSDLDPGAPSTLRPSPKRKSAPNGNPDPLQDLLHALQAMRGGDFSVRMTGDHLGIEGKIADTFNEIVAANQRMAQQLEHVGQVVGREGKTRQRVKFDLSSGSWADMEGSVNTLIDDLLWPTREVTRAVAAVAQGNLLQTVKLDVDGRPLGGEFLQSANIVNTMIKQLSVFTSEVTGVWKDLTESVNSMANNLTGQVRNIAEVTIAVANGDLSKKITVDVRGEILQRSRESFRCQSVGADVSEERPQLRLPDIRELQEIVDDALQLGNVVLVEKTAGAERAEGDGVQRLRHTVV